MAKTTCSRARGQGSSADRPAQGRRREIHTARLTYPCQGRRPRPLNFRLSDATTSSSMSLAFTEVICFPILAGLARPVIPGFQEPGMCPGFGMELLAVDVALYLNRIFRTFSAG